MTEHLWLLGTWDAHLAPQTQDALRDIEWGYNGKVMWEQPDEE